MTLEEIEKQWKEDWPYHAPVYIDWLISRVKQLEEGIRKHKHEQFGKWGIEYLMSYNDRELYNLLESTAQSSEDNRKPVGKEL